MKHMVAESSFYSAEELAALGFKRIGKGCKISRFARFYGIGGIAIGDNVRIDDFCIISGNVTLGNHIHISAYVALYGGRGIVFEDYSGISPRATVYSAMDDFGGDFLVGPIHPEACTNVQGGKVIVRRCAQIGCNSVVFPNLEIGEGCAVGACSLVRRSLAPWGVYAGVPAKRIKERSRTMLELIEA